MSLLSTLITAVGKTAQAGVRAYGNAPQRSSRRRTRKKKGGCKPCEAYNNGQEIRERARSGIL